MAESVSYTKAIQEICAIENELNLYDVKINGMPIWRSVYRRFRDKYIEQRCNIPPMSNHPTLSIGHQLKSSIISLIQIGKLLFDKSKINYLFYGFPRLEKIDDTYIDKFCDPIILQTEISNSYIYFERGRSGIHSKPRAINKQIWTEAIDNLSIIISKTYSNRYYKKHKKEFNELFKKINDRYPISSSDKKYIITRFLFHRIKAKFFSRLVHHCGIKAIFAPVMMNWPFLIKSAKDNNIPCYEIQHGITEGESPMYSGKYLEDYSPDKFLAFGETSINNFFNLPRKKIVNIGFAFKEYLKNNNTDSLDAYLIISDPEVTQTMIDICCSLKKYYSDIELAIRFHPLEKPNNEQLIQLSRYNIHIDNNNVNSSLAILKYQGIIGEKSTVLYESLSLDKKTAKLHLMNLNLEIDEDEEREKGFFIINKITDFDKFMQNNEISLHSEYYSDFKPDIFYNEILKK